MPTDKPSSKRRSHQNSYPDVLKQWIQEAQVSLQIYLILFILRIIPFLSSSQIATWTRWQRSLIISHIRVHTLYYDTRSLLSSIILWISDKEKRERVNVILFYKSAMDLNQLLFYPTVPTIVHSQVGEAQVVCTYIPSNIPVSMARKDQKHCIKPVFLISQFRK